MLKLLDEVMSLFVQYSLVAQEWNPQEEGDYESLRESVLQAIVKANQSK